MLNYVGKYMDLEFDRILEEIADIYGNKKIAIEIKGYRDNRTNQQNRLLRGQIYKSISEETGHTKEEIHWYCKGKFLLDRSGTIPAPRSTTDLNTKEFVKYVDKILKRSAEFLGLNIQMPDDYDRDNLQNK